MAQVDGDGQRRVESSLQAELGGEWKAIEPGENSLKTQQPNRGAGHCIDGELLSSSL